MRNETGKPAMTVSASQGSVADSLTNREPSNPRRHDLDALRASAMLLGIIYHAALSVVSPR